MITLIIKCTLFFVIVLSAKAKLQYYNTEGQVEKVGSRFYKKELLTNEFEAPKELAFDSASRQLYFMYMDDEIQNSGRAYVNVITKKSNKIQGIEKNKATAVDADTGDVYFGSEDGLYQYDVIENVAINIGLYNMNILQLIIRDNVMYFIDANDHNMYKVNNGKAEMQIGKLGNLVLIDVDYGKNIHYVSLCGLYCAVGGQEIVKNKDLSYVYHFIVQDIATVYGITENSIYKLNCLNGTAVKIADLDFVPRSIIHGDYGDLYYSLDDDIFRLKPIQSYVIYLLYKNNTRPLSMPIG